MYASPNSWSGRDAEGNVHPAAHEVEGRRLKVAKNAFAQSVDRSLPLLFQIRNVAIPSPSTVLNLFTLDGPHRSTDDAQSHRHFRQLETMLPRFLKTFLLASLLLILPTLFILYQKHSSGTEWNEWSLTSGTWEPWNVEQTTSSHISDRQDSALYFEEHWNAGGAAPKYRPSRIIDADREEDAKNGARVYRIGETLIDEDELEAYQKWKKMHASEAPSSSHDMETTPSSKNLWQEETVVHGSVIMPKLGNATAKYVIYFVLQP